MSTSKQQVCSDKGTLKKPESAVVTTCSESENLKNIKSVETNQESTITSIKLPEKQTSKTQMTTKVNNSMERSVLLRKIIQIKKLFLN